MIKRKFETDEQFADRILIRLPLHFARVARARYNKLYESNIRAANLYLLDIEETIEDGASYELDMTDDDIYLLAVDLVDKVRQYRADYVERGDKLQADYDKLINKLQKLTLKYNVRYPSEFSITQILARMCEQSWWLRVLRVAANKFIEGVAIDAGLVNKKQGVYISEDSLERRTKQHKRNAETLQNVKMMNTDTGEIMTLSDIVETTQANIDNRRSELLTRIKGFEELAIRYNHQAQFVTVTCPSSMHAVLRNGQQNPKYDGTKPDEAQRYLVQAWARVRAKLKRDNIKFYGLRIAEPHHDGTPHWHLVLFHRKSDKVEQAIIEAFKEHFLADAQTLTSKEKADRLTHGLKFMPINPLKGSATGYVLKYVLKNVGGIDDENESSDEAENATSKSLYPRVEAWAGTWRIRQFQQIGGHYVTVWRELRRIEECKLEGLSPSFVRTWQACQKRKKKHDEDYINANFADYIEHMGGLDTPPREGRLKVDYDYVTIRGKYGETIVPKVLGVGERFGLQVAATSRQEWVTL